MENGELPTAKVLDRDAGPDVKRAARGFGYGLLGAVFTMWVVQIACVMLAILISRRDQQAGLGFEDLGAVALLALTGFVLVRRIVRPTMMKTKLKSSWVHYASTSWVHAAFDLLWLALGVTMLSVSEGWKPGPQHDVAFAFALGFTIVPGTLFLLRLVFVSRARQALR